MTCDPAKLDCTSCSCKEQKANYEACCGGENKKCRCMDKAEFDKQKQIFKKANQSRIGKNFSYVKDQEFIEGFVGKQYSTEKKTGCKVTPRKCQQKSKCFFVKYSEQDKNCCPGQTGHHVMPGCLFSTNKERDNRTGKGKTYTEDDHKDAPTVCVAGGSYTIGTHGLMHFATRKEFSKESGGMRFGQARDASVAAHKQVFKKSGCTEECLKKQIDDSSSYNKLNKRKKQFSRDNDGGCATNDIPHLKEITKSVGRIIGSTLSLFKKA